MADNIIENIEDIDTTLNPITKDHGLEMLGNVSDQPVVLRRFSRAIFKIGGLIKGLAVDKEDKFSKNSGFNLDITHLVNSTSKILVASALAVKTAYDKALEAIGLANTNKNAIQNNTEQIENLSYIEGGSKYSGFYRKWNNGRLQQWGVIATGTTSISGELTQNFHIAFLFTDPREINTIVSTRRDVRGQLHTCTATVMGMSTTDIVIRYLKSTSASGAGFYLDYKIEGKWK